MWITCGYRGRRSEPGSFLPTSLRECVDNIVDAPEEQGRLREPAEVGAPRSRPPRLPARPPRGGGSPSSLRCLLLGVLLGARPFVLALLSWPNSVKLLVWTRCPSRISEPVPFIAEIGLLKRTARTLGRAQRPKLILSERDPIARVGSISVERGRGSGPFQTAKPFYFVSRTPRALPPAGRGASLVWSILGPSKWTSGLVSISMNGENRPAE